MQTMIDWLNGIPLAGLMLVVALGFSLGRLAWRGLTLGPAGGTILVALLLGQQGVALQATTIGPGAFTIGDFGFALFIYSVGFEAGPRFFASLMGGQGWRFVAVGAVVNGCALLVALTLGGIFDLGDSLSAGLLSGALTSPPTYAAAAETASDPTALAISFAFSYPIGLAVAVLMVQFLPRLMGDDLSQDLDEPDEDAPSDLKEKGAELTRAFEVQKEGVIGPTLMELQLTRRTGCYLTRLHRGEDILPVDASTQLVFEDHILVRGTFEELRKLEALVGPEVYDEDLRRKMRHPRKIRVTHRSVEGRTLKDLALSRRHRALVVSVERHGHLLQAEADLELQRGDIVRITGRRDAMKAVAHELGRFERPTNETDVAVFAGGIFLGLLLGQAHLRIAGAHLTLGMAGGLLLTGILLGRYRNVGLFHANVPRAARQLVRDLGILLFVAERGLIAGGSAAGALRDHLMPVLGGSVVVVAVSILVAALFAKHVLKLRPIDAWGSIGGGMTSSSALAAVKRAAESNEPALSYAASFAVASVLATIAGQIIVHILA